jgi:allantoinase
MLDLRVINGTVVDGRLIHHADLGIKDGRVAVVGAPGTLPPAREDLDVRGLLVLPGIVDTHVHFRAPERPDREDFASGTAAAAAGGVTTVFEMPITTPCCATPEVLRQRMALCEQTAYVDMGFYAAPGDLDRPRLKEMAALGAVGFKIFLHPAPANRREAFEGMAFPDPGETYRALALVHETGRVCAFHAEDQTLINAFEGPLRAAGRKDPEAHALSRPDLAEAYAIARVGTVNEQIGARVHICHVTSRLALDYIRWFQERGQRMTAETTTAYLFLSLEDVRRFGPFVKINPPLRTLQDQQALWNGLNAGILSMIVSDHAPFTEQEKSEGWRDIWPVGSGIPGLEITGRLLWHEALEGRIGLEQAVLWCSENGARLFDLFPRKGTLREGSDADFVLFDPEADFIFTRDRLFSRSRDSLKHLEGVRVRGTIRSTWLRGQMVFDGDRVVAAQGTGHVVRPGERKPMLV